MKNPVVFIFIMILLSCGKAIKQSESEMPPDENYTEVIDPGDTVEYIWCNVLVVDTGTNYYALNEKMYDLSRTLNIEIDTIGRYYDKEKDLICLPEDDEDEMYAGDYIPRRFPGEYLSIEYLRLYDQDAGEKTMALVAGIYESETDAAGSLNKLKKINPASFNIRSEIYLGCLH